MRLSAFAAAAVLVACWGDLDGGARGLEMPTAPNLSREVVPKSVTLSGPSTCTAGDTVSYTAVAKDTRGTVVQSPQLTWSSSDVTVAAIVSISGDHTQARVRCNANGTSAIKVVWLTQNSKQLSSTKILTVSGGSPPPPPPPVPVDSTGPSCSLATDWNSRAEQALAKPSYLGSTTDPAFGTKITRISGDPGTPIGNGVSGSWGDLARQNYSKDPAWSADQKLVVLKYMGGISGHLYLDGDTYQPLFLRQLPGVESRWHPTLADVMVVVTASGGVNHWNVRTNTSTTKFSTSGYSNAHMGPWEGNVSYDGRYVAVTATRNSDSKLVAYVVDITSGTKFADIDLAAQGVTNLDWVSVSALGGYVAALATVNGTLAGMKVWTKTGSVVQTWTDFRVAHMDLGVDQSGNEVIFTAPGSGTYAKRWIMRRFSDGAITALSPAVSYNTHASTRNLGRLGWGYGVTNDRTGSVLDGEMYAIKLDGSGSIERWAHHRSNVTDYDATPFAVPSPDGKRIMFASNWGSSTGRPVQTYVVSCP